MIRFPLLLFFSTFNLCIFAQDISFIKETINFNISNDTFNVYGKYTFQNKAGKIARQLVYYPINTSLDQLPYYKVSAIDSESKKELFINKFENYIVVPIEIKPYSKKNIIISYSQKIIDSSAVYILTTTKSWNLPLKKV
ncbi:MAG: hypothetical protein HGB12_17035, partial [Bacteroidetes bacterium]|nr:hypothetical protein [Bacteroidota bacterium]